MEYHKLTEVLYEGLIELFDEIAEKIVMSNQKPFGTYSEYVENSSLAEVKSKDFTTKEVVEILSKDIKTVKEVALNTETTPLTQPLLDEVLMFLDKQD